MTSYRILMIGCRGECGTNDKSARITIAQVNSEITLSITSITKKIAPTSYLECCQKNTLSFNPSRASPEISTLLGTNKKMPPPTFCIVPPKA